MVFLWLNPLSSQRVRDYTVQTQLSGRLKYPERSHVLDICSLYDNRLINFLPSEVSSGKAAGFVTL